MPRRGQLYIVPWGYAGLRGGREGARVLKSCVGFACYWPRCARALRSGVLEICISPSKGVYISRIKKIAPETDSAQTNKVAIVVALRGAKRPKLLKIMASQKTSTASNGVEMKLPPCSNISQRIFPRSIAIFNAWAWSER